MDRIASLATRLTRLPAFDPGLHLEFVREFASLIQYTLARVPEESLASASDELRSAVASSRDILTTIDMYVLLFEKGEYHLVPLDMQRVQDRKCITGPLMYIEGSPEGIILGSPLLFRILTRNIYANADAAQSAIGVHATPRIVASVTLTHLVLDYTNKGRIPPFMLARTEMADRQNLFVRGTTTSPPDGKEHGIGGAIIFDMVTRMHGGVEALNVGDGAVIRVKFPAVA